MASGRAAITPAYRWVILFIASLSFLLSFIDRLTWANVAVSVGGSLGLPVAALGIFVTAFYVGYVICNALGGIVSDRIGGRLTLTLSMLALGVFTFLFSFTTTVTFGLVSQALMGLAAGADYASCIKLIVVWFDRTSRGRAMGLFLIGSSLGVTATNAVVPTLAAMVGWEGVYRILGLVTLAVGIGSFVLLRDRPLGDVPTTRPKASIRPLLRNRNLILLGLTGFAGFWGTWGFAFWANALMIKKHGLSPIEAGFIVSLVGVFAIIGKPLIGLLSDWMGGRRKWLTFGTFVLFAGMLMVFGTLTDRLAFQIAAPFVGLGAFVYSPLMAAMVAEASGVALAGSAAGILGGIWQLGSVIVPLVVGFVFQSTGSFQAAFATLAAGPVLAAICLLFVREGAAVAPVS
ncbi:MAG TPA: MFS transporter [Stellaceae bacterium]|nr:MFS transporter [Stellaceae bacterium]